jgi:hypothetical protein
MTMSISAGIADQVLERCASLYGIVLAELERSTARLTAKDEMNALMHADYEREMERRRKQAELDRAKMQVESDTATRRYGDCLVGHTKVLALRSTEAGDIVVQAALASCGKERAAISVVHRRYHDTLFDESVLKDADDHIIPSLLLLVLQVRAEPSPPAAPSPKPPDDQI